MSEQSVPRRPYLLRAMHEWITDSGQTPHVVVDADAPDAVVPQPTFAEQLDVATTAPNLTGSET